ncbi:MAG: TonB-dependent receptor [Dysgonamonadaceae bacterium]|nr:TonB-dependent receptor [Dysgonamonadaceae bacterium]
MLYLIKTQGAFLMLLWAFSMSASAQNITIRGNITDTGGEPLIGVTIQIAGTAHGVVTDYDGDYVLSNVSPEATLQVSYIGMVTQTIAVNGRTVINIVLNSTLTDLDELVVIGYGVQRRALVTGANLNVSGEQVANLRTTTAMEALQGVTPGVQITRNHGAPGAGTRVTIRGQGTIGNSSPLYIVDGVAVGDINFLNPSDIESINVLKDAASAAIYGSRAANGVILVTTRRGRAGAPPRITYDGYFGVQNMYRKPAVLNAQEYMYLFDEARLNDGAAPYNWEQMVKTNAWLESISPGLGTEYGNYVWNKLQSGWKGTDWVDEMTMRNAPVQSHALNITGGKEDYIYALGVSYLDQAGIIGGDVFDAGFKRLTARINTEMVLFKTGSHNILTIGQNLTYTNSQNRAAATGNIYWNDLHNAIVGNPLLPLHYDNRRINSLTGGYAPTLEGVSPVLSNPVARMYFGRNFNWGKGNTIVGNVYGILEPIKNLKYRSSFGINAWFGHSRQYGPISRLDGRSGSDIDVAIQSMYQGVNYTFTNTLTYDWRMNDVHSFSALIGSEMLQNVLSTEMSASRRNTVFGLPDYAYLDNTATPGSASEISATGRDWSAGGGGLMSYMTRVSYNYAERYILDATFRADGSSNFARNNRWGYFPSLSAGWNFTEEEFFPHVDWFNFGRLRASWGQNGNQSIPNFIYLANIAYMEGGYYFGPNKLAPLPAAVPANIPNSNVKWETSEQINFGLDTRMFNSRMGFTFDWYRKQTKDWLVRAPILGTSGAAAPYINGGDVENKGFELMISWNDKVGNFSYGATVSGAANRNKVTRIANAEGIIHGTSGTLAEGTAYVSRVSVGKPIGYFWGYKTDGIFQNQREVDAWITADGKPIVIGSEPNIPRRPGDVRFVDQNGDGVINENDKVMLGSPHPKFELGLQLNAEWKGIYMNTTLVGKFGMQVMQSYRDFTGQPMENFPTSAFNRWHGEGTSNRLPRLSAVVNANNALMSDIYLYNADFLRVANLTFGYRFDNLLKSVNWMQAASIYISVNNLHTFTKYDGMDPEVGYAPDSWASGIDLGLYPLPRTVMFGVNLTF